MDLTALGLPRSASHSAWRAAAGADDATSGASGTSGGRRRRARARAVRRRRRRSLAADPSGALAFDQTTLTAKAGKVDDRLHQPSSVPHAVEVEGNGVQRRPRWSRGGNAVAQRDLKPGKYQFFCPVDGHRMAGMEGTLTVS